MPIYIRRRLLQPVLLCALPLYFPIHILTLYYYLLSTQLAFSIITYSYIIITSTTARYSYYSLSSCYRLLY